MAASLRVGELTAVWISLSITTARSAANRATWIRRVFDDVCRNPSVVLRALSSLPKCQPMPQTVYLFGTCLIDLSFPQSGLAAIRLLERAG
jgi:hypothetical protein